MKFSFFGERCREEDIGIWEEGILNRINENVKELVFFVFII